MPRASLMAILTTPWVDKTVAVVASLVPVYVLCDDLRGGQLDIPRAVAAIHILVPIGTTVLRTAPVRVTPHPRTDFIFFPAA